MAKHAYFKVFYKETRMGSGHPFIITIAAILFTDMFERGYLLAMAAFDRCVAE
jgi:hypothetical protein